MKKSFFYILIFMFSLIIGDTIYAKETKKIALNLKYDIGEDSVIFTWDDLGKSYAIYDDNEEIWFGDETTFVMKKLTKDNYSLTLIAYNEIIPIDMAIVKFQTNSEKRNTPYQVC